MKKIQKKFPGIGELKFQQFQFSCSNEENTSQPKKYCLKAIPKDIFQGEEAKEKWAEIAEERKQFDERVFKIASFYRQLLLQPSLNEKEMECISGILELALVDEALNYLINEIDENTYNELIIKEPALKIDSKTVFEVMQLMQKYYDNLQTSNKANTPMSKDI
jgi:hypothetical protein